MLFDQVMVSIRAGSKVAIVPLPSLDQTTEEQFLVRLKRGDQSVIGEIYKYYFQPVYRFIRNRVDDRTLAEDIASEVFLRLINHGGTARGPQQHIRGWLFRITRNELARHYGHGRRISETELEDWMAHSSDDDPEIALIRTNDAQSTRRALQMLVDDQQDVLLLRFAEGLSVNETAEALGKSTNAVKSLQFRALQTLRQILSGTVKRAL
jgi:RNA polymerase sigma-70 factor (ECF subfamily)